MSELEAELGSVTHEVRGQGVLNHDSRVTEPGNGRSGWSLSKKALRGHCGESKVYVSVETQEEVDAGP